MNEHTKLGLKILAGAALLGALGDGLLRVMPWGLNITVWAAALAAMVLALGPSRKEALEGGGYWLLVPAAFFSACFAWHDSPLLKILNIFALIITLSLLMLRAQGKELRHAGLVEYALGSFITVVDAMLSPVILLLKDIDWKELRSHRASRPALAVGRGILFSIPPILLFGGLFVAADPVFEDIVKNTLHLSFPELLSHCFLAAFFAWIVGGFLRGMLFGKEADLAAASKRWQEKMEATIQEASRRASDQLSKGSEVFTRQIEQQHQQRINALGNSHLQVTSQAESALEMWRAAIDKEIRRSC